jgi:hypothetical protein
MIDDIGPAGDPDMRSGSQPQAGTLIRSTLTRSVSPPYLHAERSRL